VLNHINSGDVQSLQPNKVKNAIAITLISTSELESWKETLSKSQANWLEKNQFQAAAGEVLLFSDENGNVQNIAAGRGKEEYDPWLFSKIASTLPKGVYHFETPLDDMDADLAAFGWAMADYKFDHYLKEKKQTKAVLAVPENCDHAYVSSIVRGVSLARDLVNTPTCDMGPPELAEVASNLASLFGAKIDITVGESLLKKGLNTIHTVGRAAEKEPRLIDIRWGDENAPKVTLVGKGVCFDTGGLDIKPSNAMLTMKKDMGGAAHVLGLAQMIMESELDVRLRVLIPAVENNISGNAFRPGDIIKSYKGTTIEVGNTDAEGRLVLCDALALASEEKPEIMMDFATLTGAARVALGTDVPPYFCEDKNLSDEIRRYSIDEHDPLWPLPLYKPYKKLLASNVADMNNVGSTGFGGAITAALFLQHFVGDDIPWIHFDVYAWNAGARTGRPKGGEAMGIRAVFQYLCDKYTVS